MSGSATEKLLLIKVKLAIRADNEVILSLEYSLMQSLFGRREASDCPEGNLE